MEIRAGEAGLLWLCFVKISLAQSDKKLAFKIEWPLGPPVQTLETHVIIFAATWAHFCVIERFQQLLAKMWIIFHCVIAFHVLTVLFRRYHHLKNNVDQAKQDQGFNTFHCTGTSTMEREPFSQEGSPILEPQNFSATQGQGAQIFCFTGYLIWPTGNSLFGLMTSLEIPAPFAVSTLAQTYGLLGCNTEAWQHNPRGSTLKQPA